MSVIDLSHRNPPQSGKNFDISEETVRLAYRLILGREPESEEVVRYHLATNKTVADLRNVFFGAPEFALACQGLIASMVSEQYWAAKPNIETKTSPENMALLLDRIRVQWAKLGEEDPHWSVLTADQFRKSELSAERLKEFYESGASVTEALRRFEARAEAHIKRGICLELGCGVGRISIHLAKEFERVIAADISPGNLRLCAEKTKELGLTNIETMLIRSPDDLEHLPDIDCLFSIIVLQHNSPPIQRRILETILPKIRAGGGCFFQAVAHRGEYEFSVDKYLQTPSPEMEVHCLPKPLVLGLLRDGGLIIKDISPDNCLEGISSYTYLATKD